MNRYDILANIFIVLEKMSILLVWVLLTAASILLWYFVYVFIFIG